MPTYDYVCSACGHRFERFESMHDGGTKACPKCGKKKSRRMMGTGAGLIFKGSGFYTTDSRPPAPKEAGSGTTKEGDAKKPAVAEKKEGDARKPAVAEKKKEEKEPKK